MIQLAYAEAAAGAAPQAQGSPLMSLLPLLFIFVIFYFLLIRPQQKKLKDHKKMLADIKIGDIVITSSGMYATVLGIGENTVELKIADNVKIKALKNSISEKISKPEPAEIKN